MSGIWIWLAAALLYLGFRLWYDGRRRPLSPAEIEAFLEKLEGTPVASPERLAALRAFLERDDGREFVMLNLVRLHPEPVPDPETGEPTPAPRVLRRYLRAFLPALIRRAGHPTVQGEKIGGYLDAWNVEPDPGWSFTGSMRYRSRRDMMELAADPRFRDAHRFKAAALPATVAFPTSPGFGLHVGPRIWVALVLALAVALAHLLLR